MNAFGINLSRLEYSFQSKPLLIGGKAMEYYGLRTAGADIDFVVSHEDHQELVRRYPDRVKDLHGDIGVCVDELEIWNRICLFDYDFLKEGCIQVGDICVIHLHRLLFLKAIAMGVKKYHRDLELIVKKVLDHQYASNHDE